MVSVHTSIVDGLLRVKSVRRVKAGVDELLSPKHVKCSLIKLFEALNRNEEIPGPINSTTSGSSSAPKICSENQRTKRRLPSSEVLSEAFGFSVYRAPSLIEGGGTGVFVSGVVPQHHVVALYPGTIYLPHEPLLIQSLGNPFIFRCSDGLLIDGNDRRLSKVIYRSCSLRDRIAPDLLSSDLTWLSENLQNPLNVGQYINNHTTDFKANVAYQEYDVEQDFPVELRKYLPNVFYGSGYLNERALRTIVLVSLREVGTGEELLSDYFTLIH